MEEFRDGWIDRQTDRQSCRYRWIVGWMNEERNLDEYNNLWKASGLSPYVLVSA